MTWSDKLTVVLVSFNTRDLLSGALTALRTDSLHAPRLIVVDNDSSDGSADMVATSFPDVFLIRNARNLGFAVAANMGFAHVRTPHCLLLNPDTTPTLDLLAALIRYLEQHPDVWAVGPCLLRPDGKPQALAAGFAPTLRRALCYFSGLALVLRPWPRAGFSVPPFTRHPIEVDWLSGACLCFRSDRMTELGGFDPSFFLYGEDMDLCRRIRQRGGRLVLLGDLPLTHIQGASSGSEVSAEWLRGLERYVIANLRARRSAFFFATAAAGFGLRGVWSATFKRQGVRPHTYWKWANMARRIAVEQLHRG